MAPQDNIKSTDHSRHPPISTEQCRSLSLSKFMEGREKWNAFRAHNPLFAPCLCDFDFSSQDLSGYDFRNCDFEGSDLSGCDLSGSKFDGSSFVGADLSMVLISNETSFCGSYPLPSFPGRDHEYVAREMSLLNFLKALPGLALRANYHYGFCRFCSELMIWKSGAGSPTTCIRCDQGGDDFISRQPTPTPEQIWFGKNGEYRA